MKWTFDLRKYKSFQKKSLKLKSVARWTNTTPTLRTCELWRVWRHPPPPPPPHSSLTTLRRSRRKMMVTPRDRHVEEMFDNVWSVHYSASKALNTLIACIVFNLPHCRYSTVVVVSFCSCELSTESCSCVAASEHRQTPRTCLPRSRRREGRAARRWGRGRGPHHWGSSCCAAVGGTLLLLVALHCWVLCTTTTLPQAAGVVLIIDQAAVGSWSYQTVTSGQTQQWDGKWTEYRKHLQYLHI